MNIAFILMPTIWWSTEKKEILILISDPVMEEVTTLSSKRTGKSAICQRCLCSERTYVLSGGISEGTNVGKGHCKGIKHTCRDMLAPVPYVGVKGVRTIAKLIRKWPKKKGIKTANHYLGQLV